MYDRATFEYMLRFEWLFLLDRLVVQNGSIKFQFDSQIFCNCEKITTLVPDDENCTAMFQCSDLNDYFNYNISFVF